jgi:hypothetical protein
MHYLDFYYFSSPKVNPQPELIFTNAIMTLVCIHPKHTPIYVLKRTAYTAYHFAPHIFAN